MPPPSGSPVKEAIIDDIQNTALPLIAAGAGAGAGDAYYTEVQNIQRIDAGPMELKEFPAIVLVPLSTEYNPEGTQGTLTIAATFMLQLTLFLRTRTGAASKLERFIRDVHKAVLIDRYRNANALNTRVSVDEVFYPTDDEPYTSANVVLAISYRTEWDNLNQPT